MFDLRHGDHREEFWEQEIAGEEQSEGAEVKTHFINGRPVIGTPAAGYIIPVNRCDDDHETFKPHSDVHQYTHEESDEEIASHFAEPEDLGRKHVTSHHQVITPAVRAEKVQAVIHECPAFVFVLTIPGDEKFGEVRYADNRTCKHDEI